MNGENQGEKNPARSVPDMPSFLDAYLARDEGGEYVAKSTYASEIGHPCLRYLVYRRTVPVRRDASAALLRIFARGRAAQETAYIEYTNALRGTNCTITARESSVPPNPYEIGARIDWWFGFPTDEGFREIPCEFKTVGSWSFDAINTVGDMVQHRSPWIRKYPGQIQTYMLMTNRDLGLFMLRDVERHRDKQIAVSLDLGYCEELLQKAEQVRDRARAILALPANDPQAREPLLPPRMQPYDPSICETCPYVRQCIPDITTLPEIDNQLCDIALDGWCRIREKNAEAKKAYEEADAKIGAHCAALMRGRGQGEKMVTLTDGYQIVSSVCERTNYDLPEDVKRRFGKKATYVRKDIKKVGEIEE